MTLSPTSSGNVSRAVDWSFGKAYLGSGYDVLKDQKIGQPFSSYQVVFEISPGTQFQERQTLVTSYQELNDMYKFSGEIGVSLPFGIEFGAKGSLLNDMKSNSSSVYYLFDSYYKFGEGFLTDWTLTSTAENLRRMQTPESEKTFRDTYGNAFMSKVTMGMRLTLAYRLSNINYSKTSEADLSGYLKALIACVNIQGNAAYTSKLNEIRQLCTIDLIIEGIGFTTGSYSIDDLASIKAVINKYQTQVDSTNSAILSTLQQGKSPTYCGGILSYLYGSYNLVNSDPRIETAFKTSNLWFAKQMFLQSLRAKNYNRDINDAIDSLTIETVIPQKNACLDLNNYPFVLPQNSDFPTRLAAIEAAIEQWLAKDKVYVFKDGNREYFLPTTNATSSQDLAAFNSAVRTGTNLNPSLTQMYRFNVYKTPVRNSRPLYQRISYDGKSSMFVSDDSFYADQMKQNYEWRAFMGNDIMGYIKNDDPNPELASFLQRIKTPVFVDIVPSLRTNDGPYFNTVSTSSVYPGYAAAYAGWKAFDGNDESEPWSRWISGYAFPESNAWITYDVGHPPASISPDEEKKLLKYVRSYSILPEFGLPDRCPKSWELQGLVGSTWVTLDSRTNVNITDTNGNGWKNSAGVFEAKSFTVAVPKAIRAYRLFVKSTNGSPVVSIRQLKLFY